MKALIFDVDDTLYDQIQPYYQLIKKAGMNCSELWFTGTTDSIEVDALAVVN